MYRKKTLPPMHSKFVILRKQFLHTENAYWLFPWKRESEIKPSKTFNTAGKCQHEKYVATGTSSDVFSSFFDLATLSGTVSSQHQLYNMRIAHSYVQCGGGDIKLIAEGGAGVAPSTAGRTSTAAKCKSFSDLILIS